MIQRPKITPSGLSEADHKTLVNELTKYAKEGASDEDLKKFRESFISLKKKESSRPTSPGDAGVSPTRPTQPSTSSATEPPTRAQASVALGGPTKLFGQEQQPRPTSIMYGDGLKSEEFVPPSTPIDTDQSIKYLEKKTKLKLGQKFDVEEQERNRKELERLKALKKKTPIENPVEDIYTYQFNNIRDLNNYTSKAKEEIDSDINNTGFLNVVKSGLTSAYNTVVSGIGKLADLTPQDIQYVQIDKNPLSKEISEIKSDPKNSKLTEEEINYKAYQLAIDKKAKSLRNSQTDEYLESIPEDVKDNLQFKKVDELKTIDDNTKKIVKVRDFYIASLENDYIRLNQLQQTNQDKNEIANVENRIKSNTEYIKKLDKSIYGLDRKHGNAEEEVDLLKRNYDMLYNFSGRVTQQTLNTLVSTADMIADFALVGAPRNSEYINKLKKSKDELVTETVNDINNLTNDFRKDISEVNNVNDFMNWSSDVFGVQLPTLVAASSSGGLGVIGATSMAQKRVNMKQEVLDGTAKYDDLQMLGVPLLWGSFDVVSELPTVGILKKAGLATSAINADNVLKRELINSTFNNFLKTGKEYSKDQFKENAGELFTNISQNALDKYLLGKKEVGIFDNSEEILKDTFLMTSMLQSSPHIAGAVIKPFATPEYTNTLDNNSKQILNLNKLIGDKNVSEEVKSVAKNKIAALNAESGAIVNKVISSVDKMSDAGKSRIAKIEKEQSELRAKASEIIEDKTIDVSTKKELLNDLKSQFKLVEDERINILSGKVSVEGTTIDKLPLEEQDRLKREALTQLTQELNHEGKKDITITNEQITQRAFDNYSKEMSVKPAAEVKGISPETSSNVANLTQDEEGNYVFYHTSPTTLDVIDPKKYGTNPKNVTSNEEKAAIGRVGGVSMYYPAENVAENIVTGNTHMVKIPESEVYDFNADPLNLIEEARAKFEKEYPGMAFTPNDQFAQVTKLANDRGFKMVVGEWKNTTRAQTTEPLTPVDVKERSGDVITKPFQKEYKSNLSKGFKPIIPETKQEKLTKVYDEIYNFKNSQNKYDSLYHLKEDYAKMSQEEITKMIDESDLPQELKDKYAEAAAYEPEQRRTEIPKYERTDDVVIENSPEGSYLNIGLNIGTTDELLNKDNVISMLPEGVDVLEEEVREVTSEIEGKENKEVTLLVKLSRALTDAEMSKLLIDTQQKAIPQLTEGKGAMHGTKEWGDFNPEYFYIPNKGQLSEYKSKEQVKVELTPEKINQLMGFKNTVIESKGVDVISKGIANIDDFFNKMSKDEEFNSLTEEEKKELYYNSVSKYSTSEAINQAQEVPKLIELKDQSWLKKFVQAFQNKMIRVKDVQQQMENALGIKILKEANVALKFELLVGKTINIIEDKQKEIFDKSNKNSWANRAKKDGVDIDQLGIYMYALHASERNLANATEREENFKKEVDNLNEKIKNAETQSLKTRYENELKKLISGQGKVKLLKEAGSGMTDQQAQEIIDAVDKSGKKDLFDKYANEFREKVIKPSLDAKLSYGLINQELYDKLQTQYKNYVPLQVIEKAMTKRTGSGGVGANVKGRDIFKAKGSDLYKYTDRYNPIFSSMFEYQNTIARGERNQAAQALINLAELDKNNEVFKVHKPKYTAILDSNGDIKYMLPTTSQKLINDSVELKVDGKPVYVEIKDKSMRDALNEQGIQRGIRGLYIINSWIRSTATLMNPNFLVTNFLRDYQSALINIQSEVKDLNIKNITGQIANPKNLKAAGKGIIQDSKGKYDSEWAKLAKEYRDSGGKVSWFQKENLEEYVDGLKKDIEKINKGEKIYTATLNKLANTLMLAQSVVEQSIRLSTFKALKDAGVSTEEAARAAKNITVNFENKGTWSGLVDSLYLFATAGLSGTVRMATSLSKSKTARVIAGGMFAYGILEAALNSHLGGDDDDDEKIDDGIKERNFVLVNPKDSKQEPLLLPMAYGLNVFKYAGNLTYDVTTGRKDVTEATSKIFMSIYNQISPLQGPTLSQAISPTAFDPFVQHSENKNFFGAPIKPEQPKFGAKRKESDLYFESVRPGSLWTAKKLNEWTGGSAVEKGYVDISPEILDHYYDALGGGTGKFISDVGYTGKITAKEVVEAIHGKEMKDKDEFSLRRLPFVKAFFGSKPEKQKLEYIYETFERSSIDQLSKEETSKFVKQLREAVQTGTLDKKDAKQMYNTVMEGQYKIKKYKGKQEIQPEDMTKKEYLKFIKGAK